MDLMKTQFHLANATKTTFHSAPIAIIGLRNKPSANNTIA